MVASEELLTPRAVAERLRVGVHAVYGYIYARELPAVRVAPRAWGIPAGAVERWLTQGRSRRAVLARERLKREEPAPADAGQRLLSVEEAARRLRLSPLTVRDYIRRQGLPAVRLSPRVLRVRERDLEAWLEARRRPGRGR